MRKVTNAQVTEIVSITLSTMQRYTKFCKSCIADDSAQSDTSSIALYMDDLLYMQTALNNFIQDKNAVKLQNAIMHQDTFVREYYINTLRYIEENNLTDSFYCC